MAKPYRVNAFVRINNTLISSVLRLGIKMWSFSLLTVRGRKSGKPIVTPVAIFVQDQKRYLLSSQSDDDGSGVSQSNLPIPAASHMPGLKQAIRLAYPTRSS